MHSLDEEEENFQLKTRLKWDGLYQTYLARNTPTAATIRMGYGTYDYRDQSYGKIFFPKFKIEASLK